MCRILGVSRAQYYRYRSPKPSKRRAEDADLKQRILRIFAEFKQRYGVMKIHHELNLELQPLQRRCSPRRISRLMKELDIHIDLGSQYTSDDYNQRLTELHIRHSYSRKGCPYDNAPMESFHASLKKECVYPVPVFENYETAAAVLFEYVHAFYNRKRIHSSLGYQTPLQVEVATLTSQMAA
ncbi:hypothetical protein BGL41_01385 [Fructilactobacillus sanfranciscensis]|uniref:integrase core domain-containing protein n=1 Tax=Fructilactobacillus sanfranciscensis TaxID=1625 RepID=UPI000D4CBCFA|nr:integrase core domain-containing protein [Fructilactobacillus sanfranciscensis]POH14618.1 hypothetical protein BGL41_01385 [Fructilactobacillus sanfranciscensis]